MTAIARNLLSDGCCCRGHRVTAPAQLDADGRCRSCVHEMSDEQRLVRQAAAERRERGRE